MAIEHTRGGNAIQPAIPKSLKAIAFDLDSTLCHYALTVEEVIDQALKRAGIPDERLGSSSALADDYNRAWWTAEEQLRVPTEELRRRAWIQVLKDRGFDDDELATRISDVYSEIRCETGLRLYSGVSSLLADLRERYRLGILTNGPSDMQWEKLRSLSLPSAVDAIVVAGDLGILKPDPRPFRQLLEDLDAAPADSLFVGDSFEHDIVGAHGVGMQTAWVHSNGTAERADLTPDLVIEHVGCLRELLL